VTPGNPNFFAAGFRCLRKRFHRSNGNPSRVANTRAFGSTTAGRSTARISAVSVPSGMVRALRFVLGRSKCPPYTVSQTRSTGIQIDASPAKRDSPTRKPVSTSSNALPSSWGDLAFGLAVWITRLEGLDHITQLLRDNSKQKNHALFVYRFMSEAAKIYRIAVGRPIVEFCVLLLRQRGRKLLHPRVPILCPLAGHDNRLSRALRQQCQNVGPLCPVLGEFSEF